MKKWYKSKINILGLLLVLVGVLEAMNSNLLGYLGIDNPEKWMAILGVILVIILVILRQTTSTITTPILKVGGRKKRKRTYISVPENNVFQFSGSDFTLQSVVTYTSDMSSETPITVGALFNGEGVQSVQFLETIQFNDFETLFFEVEVD